MNEQELINELAKYVKRYENATDDYSKGRYGAYKVSLKLAKRLNEQNITDEQAWNKVAEAYPESAQSLRNTLDNAVFGKTGEPQKLILPKCAEQWIEGHCAPSDVVNLFIEVTCATDSDGFIDSKWRWSTDFYEWLANDADTLYILCDALRYGYEVEKEPLYTVTINLDRKYHLVVDEGDGNDEISTTLTTSHGVLGYRYFLTEKEIKSADENLWLIAVPVEEVAEG